MKKKHRNDIYVIFYFTCSQKGSERYDKLSGNHSRYNFSETLSIENIVRGPRTLQIVLHKTVPSLYSVKREKIYITKM